MLLVWIICTLNGTCFLANVLHLRIEYRWGKLFTIEMHNLIFEFKIKLLIIVQHSLWSIYLDKRYLNVIRRLDENETFLEVLQSVNEDPVIDIDDSELESASECDDCGSSNIILLIKLLGILFKTRTLV